MLMAVKESNRSHLDGRGVSFRFMWMDVEQEPAFKELFAPDRLPNFVIFNAHKRLRFTKLESEVEADKQSVNGLIEKVTGGSARFQNVKGQKLPKFAERDEKAKAGKEEL
eukprot:GHVT01047912.1.p1 GENE.GHVT01047912.1~~GHVT01047912.1.p1  ORF type:complete len:110 (-),score=27.86 GHVT01047912.1:976-1305(-)